jgi:hypothetical protein
MDRPCGTAAPEDPIHAKAAAFVKQVFPVGGFEVTSMAYVDEPEHRPV